MIDWLPRSACWVLMAVLFGIMLWAMHGQWAPS